MVLKAALRRSNGIQIPEGVHVALVFSGAQYFVTRQYFATAAQPLLSARWLHCRFFAAAPAACSHGPAKAQGMLLLGYFAVGCTHGPRPKAHPRKLT